MNAWVSMPRPPGTLTPASLGMRTPPKPGRCWAATVDADMSMAQLFEACASDEDCGDRLFCDTTYPQPFCTRSCSATPAVPMVCVWTTSVRPHAVPVAETVTRSEALA